MLLSRVIPVVFLAMTLMVTAFPVTAAPADECRQEVDPDVDSQRLGRPCIQVDLVVSSATDEATCVHAEAARDIVKYKREPMCTFYFILVPFADGGRVAADGEFDPYIVYLESNDIPGLQTGASVGVPTNDQPILI